MLIPEILRVNFVIHELPHSNNSNNGGIKLTVIFIIMNFINPLKIKLSFFKNGWSNFDAVTYNDLCNAIDNGATINQKNSFKEIYTLMEYPSLMAFGKVSINGEIIIEGITGFPLDSDCIKLLNDLYSSSKNKKISNNYIYIEL